MYEVFDHTADLGLRIRAADLPALFAEAARAFLVVAVSKPDSVEPREVRELQLEGADLDYLFFDWLNELLFLVETKRFLPSRFDVTLLKDGLSATVHGEPYDPERHELAHEIKAITYHGLRVEQTRDLWLAEVILDI